MKDGFVLVSTGFLPSCVNCARFCSCRDGVPHSPFFPSTWTFDRKRMAAGFPEGDLLVGFKTGHPVCDMDGEGCPEYEPKRECTMPCLGKHREYARLEGKRVDLEEKAGHDGGEAGAEWLDTVGRQAMLLTLPKGEEPC